jgi:hypothetical protein
METTNPFNTVHVGSQQQLWLLVKKTQADNSLSAQVSNLIFDAGFYGSWDVSRVQKHLPHLGAFVCLENEVSVPEGDIVESRPWNQLKHVAIRINHVDGVRYVIQDLCPNLTELVLRTQYLLRLTHLTRFFENTPALTTLAVSGFEFAIGDLEVVHRSLPLLTSLALSTLYIDDVDLSNLPPIVPATRVSKVYMDTGIGDQDAEIQALEYISRKYTNAQKLTYKSALSEHEPSNGIPTVITSLGSQLTELSLFTSFNATDLVSALNATHCQLKVLKVNNTSDVLNALTQYNSAQYIEALYLTIGYNDEQLSIEKLASLSALKHLDISWQRENINLSRLLDVLGNQLESLGLYNVGIGCTRLTAYPKYKLKKLTLNHIVIPTRLDHFISQSLPHLRDLAFECCRLHNIHLKLPNTSLNHLLIKDTMVFDINKLLVKSLNNHESRWYYAKPGLRGSFTQEPEQEFTCGPISTYPPVRSLPLDAYNGIPFATIECRSVCSVSVVYER